MTNGITAGAKSHKTTAMAIITALMAILGSVQLLMDGNPDTNPDWGTVAGTLATAIGLLFARDADKSSEDSGAKP